MMLQTPLGQCTQHMVMTERKINTLVLKPNLLYSTFTLLNTSDFSGTISPNQLWVNIFSLQNLLSIRAVRSISLLEQKYLNKAVENCHEHSLWLFKASQPEDPIIPFTTQNTEYEFMFRVDSYALAFISVVKRDESSALPSDWCLHPFLRVSDGV